jgi:cell wall-associated NlpC family hydrolase
MSVQSSPPGHSALTVLRRLREVALVIQKPIALDPGIGGCSVGDSALQAADIIISTTGAIRIGTSSVVSHGALYCGSGSVIEAIGQGVVSRSIYDSLADDALAVAYRHPAVTSSIAAAIVAFASSHIGDSYSVKGAAAAADPILCRIVGTKPAAFFCTQLVIEAYRQGGMPLTSLPAQCVTPQGVAEIAFERLVYVGHLKGNASWFPTISP